MILACPVLKCARGAHLLGRRSITHAEAVHLRRTYIRIKALLIQLLEFVATTTHGLDWTGGAVSVRCIWTLQLSAPPQAALPAANGAQFDGRDLCCVAGAPSDVGPMRFVVST
ncbi:MAG: hypothetical protein JWN70_5467 [Planctomycetaceae bacterium]|nr:hypothetical protein [Planctomycetaceae bacterium]